MGVLLSDDMKYLAGQPAGGCHPNPESGVSGPGGGGHQEPRLGQRAGMSLEEVAISSGVRGRRDMSPPDTDRSY
jgi:hypothetical protein